MRRALLAAALIGAAALVPAIPHAAPRHPAPTPTPDTGCALYVSIPNPCDPDSAN